MARLRDILPTTLGTAEIRERMAKDLLAGSVFSARVANADFLTTLKKVTSSVANGEMDEASARLALLETLRAIGYTPEGGFPDTPEGEVPPAVQGSLEDLSSFRRLDLIVRTQADLLAGAGEQLRGHEPARLAVAPAWELVRIVPVRVPRDWPARWVIAGGTLMQPSESEVAKWEAERAAVYEKAAARKKGLTPGTSEFAKADIDNAVLIGTVEMRRPKIRMIALKGDPIWGELGSSGNFDDALDVDYPPFAFNSGMGWREVLRSEVEELGVTGPAGESIDEWLRGETRPRVIAGELPYADPVMSIKNIDPELVKDLKEGAEVTADGKLTPAGGSTRAERRAARKAESDALWAEARARRTNVEATDR